MTLRRPALVMLAVLAVALTPVAAQADNGPHGGYSATTDSCAGCHRAHTASAPGLLTADAHDLCLSCHGSVGAGADTNVMDGVYTERDGITESPSEQGVGVSLKGGGFVNVVMDSDWDGAAVSASVTSTHIYNGGTGTAWGNGAIGSGPGAAGFSLTCTSCHDPHGGAGIDPVTGERIPSYRLLRDIPIGSNAGPLPSSSDDPPIYPLIDETNKVYTLSNTIGDDTRSGHVDHGKNEFQYFGEPYWFVQDSVTRYRFGLTEWCSQCHTRYLGDPYVNATDPGSGSDDSGDPDFHYRHATIGETNKGNLDCVICHFESDNQYNLHAYVPHNVGCVSCHVAHGSSALMTTDGPYSGSVEWQDGLTSPSGDQRSSLLRVDNRGVCELCHEKG